MALSSIHNTTNKISLLNGTEHTLNGLEEQYRQSANTQDYISRYFDYLSNILVQLDKGVIEKIIKTFAEAAERGSTIYLIGNGGSAATASHMANDFLVGTWLTDHAPFRVVALTDNVPVMTAIANDADYKSIFAHQIRVLANPGDILLALSVSGNSPNIIDAVQVAKTQGMTTIGCCGFDGGQLQEIADICLHIPSNRSEYGPVEDVMMILDHLMHSYFMLSRRGTLQRY